MSVGNIHKNHRARMREKIFSSGLKSFHDHELLEMFLYSCYSRINTNDIAHALLNKFGSLQEVFAASESALRTVDGVGDAAVAMIATMRELMIRIDEQKIELPRGFESFKELGEYLVKLYKFSSVEQVYMLMFDNGMRLIGCTLISEGTVNFSPVQARKVMMEAMKNEASSVIIAHNHPRGKLIASSDDIVMTRNIASAINSAGV